jgi:fructosamine-3-kinase
MSIELPAGMVEAVAGGLEAGGRITSVAAVSGGDINEAARVDLDSGERYFLKWNRAGPRGMFAAEADGLAALHAAASDDLLVPHVRATGVSGGVAWLIMDHIESAPPGALRRGPSWGVRLGRGLAALHSGSVELESRRAADGVLGGSYGWTRDNFIGSLPQANAPTRRWATFWRDRRIGPQVRQAADAGALSGEGLGDLERLLDRMEAALAGAEADGPSLLHGDLWGGNVMAAADGRAAIYDPAVYRGHREVDLAMSELFGFTSDFMPAYRETWPPAPEYDAYRRDLYQLYYLLAHVNLFGAGYVAPSVAAARRVLAAI